MNDLDFSREKIQFRNPDQILNMGGPWIGELFLGDCKVMDDVIIDNLQYNEEQNRLYFVRYHKVSRWSKENYFSINYINLSTSSTYMYDLK